MESINVEKIMGEIRKEIKEQGYKLSDISFKDVKFSSQAIMDEEAYRLAKDNINKLWSLDLYCSIPGFGVKLFIKRVIRKIVRAVLYHQLKRQEEFNANVVRIINHLSCIVAEQQKTIEKLES